MIFVTFNDAVLDAFALMSSLTCLIMPMPYFATMASLERIEQKWQKVQ